MSTPLLQLPKETLDSVIKDCARVDTFLEKNKLPPQLKKSFGEIWGRSYEVGQDYIRLTTSKSGDKKRSYFVEDEVLLKCAFAVKIYDIYKPYMQVVAKLRESTKIDSDSWKKCGEDKPLPEELKTRIRSAISDLEMINDTEKSYLVRLLTDDKEARKEDFGRYKGLSRDDPFQPVAAGALGLRVDHYGIINEIIIKLQENKILNTNFLSLLDDVSEKTDPALKDLPLSVFVEFLKLAGFGGAATGRNFALALASKPFVILTGNSGTGKTKIAALFTQWLSGDVTNGNTLCEMIPVGADWTDNRNVLGFVNHLRPSQDGRPLYESTPILELIIRAVGDSTRPYFLILDEMNLSHVERYFADFLSAMESGRPIPLHTSSGDLFSPQGTKVPATLALPDNLFITGTVNVDETTYMFSPKVLDRANVIEFRVTKDDAGAFLAAGAGGLAEIAAAPAGAAQAFLALSRKARKKPVPDLVFHSDDALKGKRKALSEALTELFGIMHKHRMEFGYRTMHEVLRYAGVDYELAADRATWSWAACLDVQILQKILPKLHGSKKRVEQLVVDLAVFCETGAAPAGTGAFAARSTGKITYPQSYEKLACMIEAVRRDQFVSFI